MVLSVEIFKYEMDLGKLEVISTLSHYLFFALDKLSHLFSSDKEVRFLAI
ncbi:Uncharacterised protein [Proteus vulgaris]|jgi:hypothetical protein|nr:Uncharacterised protein [Proteus vulgaris]